MAEEKAPEGENIDIDSMDDAAFAEFKDKLGTEKPEPEVKQAEPPREAAKADPAEDADDPEAGGQTRETVPHGQFHRERERRKAAEAERDTFRGNLDKALARMQSLLDQQSPSTEQKAEEPAIPTWDKDPMAAGQWTQQQLIELSKRLQSEDQQRQERSAQAEQFNRVFEQVNAEYTEALKADPTVGEAHGALRASMVAEMEAIGMSRPDIVRQVNAIENQHLLHIGQNRLDVGEYIKKLAGARGWQPKKAEPKSVENDAEKLLRQEETRKASLSLGRGSGAVPNTGAVTPQQLLDMSDDEFDAYKAKHGGSIARAFLEA